MAKIKLADYIINFYSNIGVDKIFDAIINKIPPPSDNDNDKTRALIFD